VNTSLRWRRRRWTGETAVAELPDRAAAAGGYQQVDVRESLRRALRELTAKQRAVIMLRYFEDRTEAETAVIMGCSTGTVGGASPQIAPGTSTRPSPHASAACQGRTVTVPNVVGESMDAADAMIHDVGHDDPRRPAYRRGSSWPSR